MQAEREYVEHNRRIHSGKWSAADMRKAFVSYTIATTQERLTAETPV